MKGGLNPIDYKTIIQIIQLREQPCETYEIKNVQLPIFAMENNPTEMV